MSETPSVLDYNLENIPVLEAVEEGDFLLQLDFAQFKEGNTNGRNWKQISCRYSLPDVPSAKDIYHNVWLPTDDDDEKATIKTLNRYRIWLQAHGVDTSVPVDLADMIGSQCWALLGTGEYKGEAQNNIRRFSTPK